MGAVVVIRFFVFPYHFLACVLLIFFFLIFDSVMIALGDLAFRFPNSIEPWTPRMYSRCVAFNVLVW